MQATRSNSKKDPLKSLKSLFCSACLSSDRKLLLVLGEFKDIYKQICKNFVRDINSETLLCWECSALLRNVQKFQEKLRNSQIVLRQYISDDKKNIIRSFTNLAITTPILYDSNKTPETVLEEDQKPEPTIKLEEDHADFNDFDFEPLEEIKDGTPPEIYLKDTIEVEIGSLKQEPSVSHKEEKYEESAEDVIQNDIGAKPEANVKEEKRTDAASKKKKVENKSKRLNLHKDRSELYRIHYDYSNISKVNAYTRIPIEPEEAASWLERERNSKYFKTMRNKCVQCAIRVSEKEKLTHFELHKPKGPNSVSCVICGCHFARKGLLSAHIRTHCYIRSCTACGFRCVHKWLMYSHVKNEHEQGKAKFVQCLECNENHRSTREFYKHYREVHYVVNSEFQCDYCKVIYKKKAKLEKHIWRHHTRQVCTDCNLTFADYGHLLIHTRLKHRVERTEASYCVMCDRQFDNVLQFKNHVSYAVAHAAERRTVKKNKQHPCPACPKVYRKCSTMKNHYNMVHADVPRFRCPHCDKVLFNNSKLRDHVKYNHQGFIRPKDKMCTVCGRGFTQKTVLVKHMRTHTGERPYECPHCESKFAQRTAMLTHVKNIHAKREMKYTSV